MDLSRAVNIIGNRMSTLELLADPLVAVDYDGMRSEGISDPTPRHAQQLAHWHSLQHRIELHVQILCAESKLLVEALSNVPTDIDTAAIARKHRCSGGQPSTDRWTRPECSNLAVTRDGLCDACRQRRDDWRRKQETVDL